MRMPVKSGFANCPGSRNCRSSAGVSGTRPCRWLADTVAARWVMARAMGLSARPALAVVMLMVRAMGGCSVQALLGKIADVLQDPLQRDNLEPVTPKHLKTTGIFGQYNLAADLIACRHCYKSRCYTDFSIPKNPEHPMLKQLMLATSVRWHQLHRAVVGMQFRLILLTLGWLALAGCASNLAVVEPSTTSDASTTPTIPVYVASHGWHTGELLPAAA